MIGESSNLARIGEDTSLVKFGSNLFRIGEGNRLFMICNNLFMIDNRLFGTGEGINLFRIGNNLFRIGNNLSGTEEGSNLFKIDNNYGSLRFSHLAAVTARFQCSLFAKIALANIVHEQFIDCSRRVRQNVFFFFFSGKQFS